MARTSSIGPSAAPAGEPVRFTGRAVDRSTVPVVLVNPPAVAHPGSVQQYVPGPPLGLAYVAAATRAAGHPTRLVDAAGLALDRVEDLDTPVGRLVRTGLSVTEVVDRIGPGPAVVGITNMFVHDWPTVRAIAEEVRARGWQHTIVVGGETATGFWPWALRECAAIDYCVLGEGEETFLELLACVHRPEDARAVAGVAFVDPATGEPRSTGLRRRMRDIDALPRPAWDLVPLADYWAAGPGMALDRGRSIPMLMTRGCPYRCTFCSSPQMWTTRFVTRSVTAICDEIEDLQRTYGVTNVVFHDLTAITKRRWTVALCDEILARGIRVSWQMPSGTRSEALEPDVLRRMAEAGCALVTYAPETGSERMLRVIDKRADIEWILTSGRLAAELGISTSTSIVLGHPEERWRDVAATARYVVRAAIAGFHDCGVAVFSPYPGSADFVRMVEDGSLVVDDAFPYIGLVRGAARAHRSHTTRFGPRVTVVLQFGLMGLFYAASYLRRPSRLWAVRTAARTGVERTRVDAVLAQRRRAATRQT